MVKITAEEWARRQLSGDIHCSGRVAEVEEARLLAEMLVNAEAEAVNAAVESRRAALVAEIRAAVLSALVDTVCEVAYEGSGAAEVEALGTRYGRVKYTAL